MFERLLKPKFHRKCKSSLDYTKSRIETIRKKRKAVEKFLKNDIAELLRSGLDYNAYGRAEGYLVEQNMSSCYELVLNFVKSISEHLQVLCKESNCPDECKEAVQSLMHAAARFADLPELRELRTLFTEKFGDSLEPYISKEFVEKLRLEPTKEMKIQILRDVAQEFSIKWNSKALEESLISVFPSLQEKPKHQSLNEKHIRNSENSWMLQTTTDDETSTDISQDGAKIYSLGSVSGDEVESDKRPSQNQVAPDPYFKPKPDKEESMEYSNQERSKPSHETNQEEQPKLDKEEPNKEKPKPRSVRSRGRKVQSVRNEIASDNVSSPRDIEEERILDELLMQECKKVSPYDSSKVQNATINNHRKLPEEDGQFHRGKSLPAQISTSSVGQEVPGEAARHVHPKLPDYDDLTARLAAIKGR